MNLDYDLELIMPKYISKYIFFSIYLPEKYINEEIEFEDEKPEILYKKVNKLSDEYEEYYAIFLVFIDIKIEILRYETIHLFFKLKDKKYELSLEPKTFNFTGLLKEKSWFFILDINIPQKVMKYKDIYILFMISLNKKEKLKDYNEYKNEIINEGILSYKEEEKKDFDYFILLFYNCYKNKKYIYELFSLYDNEILQQKNNNELFKLKDYIEEIYNNKKEVLNFYKKKKRKRKSKLNAKKMRKIYFTFV